MFVNSPPDPSAIFFSVAISQSGDKFSLLDAPMEIAQTLGNNLRSAFPHKIASDRAKEDGIYVIELKRGVSGAFYFALPAYDHSSSCLLRIRSRSECIRCLCLAFLQYDRFQIGWKFAYGEGRTSWFWFQKRVMDLQRFTA